ncbi:hypothetical protein P4V58_10625 [Bacillus wiedmannii]|nr:hypothetical protein [Bacillus wiedmannii]
MKYEHAITLDKPLLSLGGIIKIYQRNEVTEPIRKRDFSIYRDTEDYIADKMTALHIDYDEYYNTIFYQFYTMIVKKIVILPF